MQALHTSGGVVFKMTVDFKRKALPSCKSTAARNEPAAPCVRCTLHLIEAVGCASLRSLRTRFYGPQKFSSQVRFFIEYEVIFFPHVGDHVFLSEVCTPDRIRAFL